MFVFSPLKNRRFIIRSLFVSLFAFAFGCTKLDKTSLGSDLIPGADLLATDTIQLPVESSSFIETDTLVAVKGDQHIIGFVNDPMFGTTTAAAYFQMLPASYPFSFPVKKDSLFLDSVVLSLSFNGTYGDTNAISKINVYRLTDPSFVSTGRYPVSKGFNFSVSDILGTKSFTAKEIRTGYKLAFKSDSVFNQLRIRLSDAFGRSLLDQDNITGAFRNDTAFKQFFNGFAVVPDSLTSGNAIHYFTLNGTNSRINLYYRVKNTTGATDTTVSFLPFVADTVRSANANKIHRNYSGSTAEPFITSATPSSLVYIQTAPGTGVKVKVPALDTLVGKKYIVHRAELVAQQVYQGPTSAENLFTPPSLHLFTIGADGKNATIPYDSTSYWSPASFDFFRDKFLFNVLTTYTGGTPSFTRDASNNTVAVYRMNITRYVQNIINGNTTRRDFKLTAPFLAEFGGNILSSVSINPIAFGRVQLGGGTHPQYRMKVCIYYSKQ
jgi:hypothetical protein